MKNRNETFRLRAQVHNWRCDLFTRFEWYNDRQ